jgi:hypothetical protein
VTQPGHPSDEQLCSGGEAVDEHLAACAHCRNRHQVVDAEQQAVRRWLRATTDVSPDQRMPDDVTARLEKVVRREASRRDDAVVRPIPAAPADRRFSPGRPWLVAAAVAGVAVVGGTLLVPALDRGDLLAGGDDAGTELVDAESDAAAETDGSAGAGSAAETAVAPVPPVPPDVAAQAAPRTDDETLDSCGQVLADELGGVVEAATEVTGNARGGVLVTLDVADQQVVWWLPGCAATSESAWGRDELE